MPYYYFPFVEHLSTSSLLKDWIDSYTFFYSSYHLLLLYVTRITLNRDTSHFISKNCLRDDDVSKRARRRLIMKYIRSLHEVNAHNILYSLMKRGGGLMIKYIRS